MLTNETLLFWLIVAFIGAVVWQLLGKRLFSNEARARRRRRRNYGRVISRRQTPAVKLAVKV